MGTARPRSVVAVGLVSWGPGMDPKQGEGPEESTGPCRPGRRHEPYFLFSFLKICDLLRGGGDALLHAKYALVKCGLDAVSTVSTKRSSRSQRRYSLHALKGMSFWTAARSPKLNFEFLVFIKIFITKWYIYIFMKVFFKTNLFI